MQSWFGFNPLDVILGVVAFCCVAVVTFDFCEALKNHRAQKQAEQENNPHIDLTQ
jgi:hypothetical protein